MKKNDAISLINDTVRALKAYHLEPETVSVKLNQNENPFDWPLQIKEQIAAFCIERPWNRYPPFIPEKLKRLLADYVGVSSDSIIVGNGSNEMLLVLMLSLVKRSSKAIVCQPTFTVYRLLLEGMGSEALAVNLDSNLNFDIDTIIETSQNNSGSVLILCSPNNPTGTSMGESELRRVLDRHTGFCILDQAYVEFGGFNAIPLLKEYPNLIITRTFSKAFAGAGLRLGYMIGSPEIISEINKIKLPYNINFFSDHVASVLLQNREMLQDSLRCILSERDSLFSFLQKMPFDTVYPSSANFFLVRTEKKQAYFEYLKSQDVLVRDVSNYPMLQNCLRISVGTIEENALLKEATSRFFGV